jgi:hypothetical protein
MGQALVCALLVGGCAATLAPTPTPTATAEASVRVTVPEPTGPAEAELPLRLDESGTVVDRARASGPASALSLLSGLLADDERFGTAWVDRGGTLVLVWHGDPPRQVLDLVAQDYPETPVRIEALHVAPRELREMAESLAATEPHVRAAHVREDFSSIVVQVRAGVTNHLTLAERLTAAAGFPVEVEVGPPVP